MFASASTMTQPVATNVVTVSRQTVRQLGQRFLLGMGILLVAAVSRFVDMESYAATLAEGFQEGINDYAREAGLLKA